MYMSTQNGHSRLATFLVETESRNTLVNSKKKTWRWWQAIVLRPIPLPRALALPSPSHQDATTPSPCWAPHFMTQERLLFSNPNPSELRLRILPPRRWATTCCRFSLLPCPAPLSCSLQPLLKLSLLSLRPSLLQFVSIDSLLLSHENPSFEPMCVFHLFISCLCFLIAMNFSFKSLFAIWSLSPQRFHYHFFLSTVSWQYQKYSTILILVLCLLCNAVGLLILFKLCPVFTFLQQLMTKKLWVIYTYTCSPMFSIDVVASAPDDPCICW